MERWSSVGLLDLLAEIRSEVDAGNPAQIRANRSGSG